MSSELRAERLEAAFDIGARAVQLGLNVAAGQVTDPTCEAVALGEPPRGEPEANALHPAFEQDVNSRPIALPAVDLAEHLKFGSTPLSSLFPPD